MFGYVKRTGSNQTRLGTLVARGLTIEGELSFTGAIRVDGTVRGAICVPVDGEGALFVGAEASIEGDIRATEVTIEGRVAGSVFATGTVIIGPSGRVTGEVHYGALELAPGAEVQGLLAPVRQHGPAAESAAPRGGSAGHDTASDATAGTPAR